MKQNQTEEINKLKKHSLPKNFHNYINTRLTELVIEFNDSDEISNLMNKQFSSYKNLINILNEKNLYQLERYLGLIDLQKEKEEFFIYLNAFLDGINFKETN